MSQNGEQLQYGKVSVSESYFDGKLRSKQTSITESHAPRNMIEAHAHIIDQTTKLITESNAQKKITIELDLDNRTKQPEIKHVHITHIIEKLQS